MTIDRLRKAVRAEPFIPFTIRTADSRAYPVPHPEFILVPPKAERTFVVVGPEDPEDYTVIDLLLVASIDYGKGASANGGRA